MADVLYTYIHHLKGTYDVIATKVEDLIQILNTAESSDHDGIRGLAARINIFLSRFNYSIMFELKEGKNLGSLLPEFKESITEELLEIKKLQQTISLAPDHPDAHIIREIHRLSQEIEHEINHQESIAKRAKASGV